MNLKRIFAIVFKFGFLLNRNKTRFINILGWSVLDILVWGLTATYLNEVNKLNFNFIAVILSGAVLWLTLIRVQQGFILPMLEDVWSKNFLNLFASPLKIREYVLGLAISAFATSVFAFAIILLIVRIFFSYNIFYLGFMLVGFLLVIFIFGLALGLFTVGIILRYGPSAEWIAWIIPFAIAPLSSVYYPLSVLPAIIQPVSKILPTPYVFEGMRAALFTEVFLWDNLMIGLAIAIAYFIVAYWFLNYMYKLILRNGLLARFGVESL